MKNTLLLLLLVLMVGCSSASNSKMVFVFDNEQILTKEQEAALTKLFQEHEKKTTNEIVLVTTPNWNEHKNALFFSVNFGDKHGVGKKEKDNGVVIVFSNEQRETRISTGFGTEKVLKDLVARKIIDSLMIPNFRENNYFDGLFAGSKAIVDFLEQPGNEIRTSTNKK